MEKKNVGPFIQNALGSLRWQRYSFKPRVGPWATIPPTAHAHEAVLISVLGKLHILQMSCGFQLYMNKCWVLSASLPVNLGLSANINTPWEAVF